MGWKNAKSVACALFCARILPSSSQINNMIYDLKKNILSDIIFPFKKSGKLIFPCACRKGVFPTSL